MTREREEAIEYIKGYRKLDENLYNSAPPNSVSFRATKKCLEYWDMAIKALENEPRFLVHSDGRIEQIIEPCDDCVSRQALLEFFKDDDYVVNEINNMPSVLPKREQGEWIRADKLIKSLRDSCEGFWRKKMLINGEPLSEALSFELNTIKRCIKDLKDEEMR